MDKSSSNGQTQIDRAHFEEIREHVTGLIGRLKWLSDSSQKHDAYSLAVEIRDFLASRFEYEFQVMIHNCHGDTVVHHQQHQLLLEQLSWAISLAREQDCIPSHLCDFLTDWFRVHSEVLDARLYGLQVPTTD